MFILILLYLILTIIRPQDYMPALAGVPAMPAVLMLAFLVWLTGSRRNFDAPQFLILPAFLLVGMSSQVVNGWGGGALNVLTDFGPTVIAFFVLAASCTTRHRVTITMMVFVVCATVLALHSIDQANTGMGWTGLALNEDGRVRYVGIFNDPNDLGLLFAATLPMAFFLSSLGGLLRRLFWLIAVALLLYGTYLTNSRGAMLAVLAVGGIYIWRRRGIFTAGVLAALGLVGMRLLSSRMQDLDPDESSAFGRVDAWYEGMHMFFSHPLFGVGPGNFTDYNYLTAHNSFVLVLAETGFIGYTLWLAFVVYGFWMMLTVLRYQPESSPELDRARQWRGECNMAFTLLLSLSGLFVCAFFLSRSYTVVLYLLIAVVVGYYMGMRQRWPGLPVFRLSRHWVRWLAVSMGSIVLLYIITTLLLIGT
ncbi:MAG TPA: O-antigen ligase family protein [Rhodanobacter sp.]|nr:O-antigen ligase family protein [Rhodanobacter sp.]